MKIATNDDKLSFLTIADLKKILKANSLKVSGKKSELIDRIKNNIPNNKYQCYLPIEGYIMRTDRGTKNTTNSLKQKMLFYMIPLKKLQDLYINPTSIQQKSYLKNFIDPITLNIKVLIGMVAFTLFIRLNSKNSLSVNTVNQYIQRL